MPPSDILHALVLMLAAVPATARAVERPPATLAESVMALAAERNLVIAFDTATLAGLPGRVAPRGLSPRQTIETLVAGTPVSVREVKRGVFVLLAGGPKTVATPPPPSAPEAPALVEPVTINAAYARSLDRSLALKRKAAYGLDAVSAEDIARLPAFNAAEALQLAPGVSLERHRGVGLYVSVRGLGPQFQNVLLNGRPIALNDLVENGGFRGRQFRFEVLPADVIDQIEVVKTTTADMDEGALGGDIDVRTFKPLDRGRRSVLSVRASEGRTDKVDPSVSGVWSWVDASGRLGVLAGGVVERRRIRNDRLYQTGWNLDRFTSVLGPGLYTPTRTRPTVELEDRRMASGDFTVQWRPTNDLSLDFDLLATRLDAHYDEYGLDIYPDDPSVSSPRFVAGTQVVKGDTVQAGTIDNVRWMASQEISLNRHDLVAVGAHGRWVRGPWTLDGDWGYSRARSYHPDGRGTVRARVALFAPLTYDFSHGLAGGPDLRTPVDYADPANYVGQSFDYTFKDSRDVDETVKLDLLRPIGAFDLRLGAESHRRSRDYRRRDWTLDTLVGQPLTDLGPSVYGETPFSNFLSGVDADLPRRWVAPNAKAFYDLLYTPVVAARPPTAADLRNSFVVEEKIRSAYARLDFQGSAFGLPIDGNMGLRYAATRQVSKGVLSSGSDPLPAQWRKAYGDWLPSINLKVALRPRLYLRLAASRVVSRPNVVDNAPRITIARDTPTANGGNPELDPFLATQLDASVEWYAPTGGALSLAAFDRRLDDYITAQNTFIEVPGRGQVLLSTNVNGGQARIQGLELTVAYVFRDLPAPFDGLGVQGAATLVRSQANYFAGDRTIRNALLGLSRATYSAVVFYEKGRGSVRLGYNWRGPYLTSIGSSITAPATTAAFGSLDGAASWRIDRRATLSLEGVNLTDARRYVYGESRDQPMEIHHWGRYLSARMRWAF
ncbi:TonB-dependent receptor [Caulobacter sp. RL271]|uniref:TonB-dependent receptor n=1 Tax=Caulobacter segnis TaxID=88688 RepID=A0ABY4ZUU7_9CAUL|nr:TonB-dependent receptor [Caulobacter segnis]USQ96593.1 TonB-dependent receptor [Caulobacter segnis]